MDGHIKFFNASRGWGFITPLVGRPGQAGTVFFHVSAFRGRPAAVEGARVRFILVEGRAGAAPQAADIELVQLSGKALYSS